MMIATPCAGSETYESFAPYYDAFTSASDYDVWTERVLELARGLGLRGNTLLDLACGTGKSFLPFLRLGFRVTACDLSASMLAEAAPKAPQARLLQADMRTLGAIGSFDLVTCFDDSLNYLRDEHELAAAFESIAANLSPSGLALFDLNTLLAYRTTFASDSAATRDETMFVWRGESFSDAAPGCVATARIDVFAARRDGLYERIATRHEQRHFPQERVTVRLRDAGLECLGVYGVLADGSLVPESDELSQLKVLYAARRQEGGDAQ